MTVEFKGRVDSNSATRVERETFEALSGCTDGKVVIDAQELQYISSAGLRVILHIKKSFPDVRIINVCPDVYDILEMTGFTEMMTVEKAYRTVSVEGCEEIGRGANGIIYRIDEDNVVKVYSSAGALADIQHERQVAKLALILGIPTAISYDVVRVGDSYGSVFELLSARSFSKILAGEPDKFDWCVDEFVGMLKKIHGTLVPEGKLPDIKETAVSWVRFVSDYIPEETAGKLLRLVEEVPQDNHMIHGDYHTKNLQLQGEEVLIIDMDTLSVGNPVFELASIFNSLVGYSEYDHDVILKFQGYDYVTGLKFWKKFLAAYLGTDDEKMIADAENKARAIGYTRMIRRSIRRGGLEAEPQRSEIELWKKRLIETVNSIDSLIIEFPDAGSGGGDEIEVDAVTENLPVVTDFIEKRLEAADCPPKTAMQIALAAEEIFVNIASYAYAPGTGRAGVRVKIYGEPAAAEITFTDSGVPYNPLAKTDPDVSIPADDRQIGGLGIFLTKKSMDDVRYEYHNGKNVLTMTKRL